MDWLVQTSQQQITASPGREKRFAPAYRNGGMRGLALTIVTLAAVVVSCVTRAVKRRRSPHHFPEPADRRRHRRLSRARGLVS